MFTAALISVFWMALLGGMHCAAMCGGIVGALGSCKGQVPTAQAPIGQKPLQFHAKKKFSFIGLRQWPHHLGRMISYALLGSLVASWGPWVIADHLWLSKVIFFAANVLIAGMGFYMGLQAFNYKMPYWHRLKSVNAKFARFFQFYAPSVGRLMAKCLPADTPLKRFCLGLGWGLLPCGMIYSALALAALLGSPLKGAGIMLALWLGTLPNMVWIEGLWSSPHYLKGDKQSFKLIRMFAALMMIVLGIWGMAKLVGIEGGLDKIGVCITRH